MDELRRIIEKKGLLYKFIAKQLGITPTAFTRKLNGQNMFNAVEISKLRDILDLSMEQVDRIFL